MPVSSSTTVFILSLLAIPITYCTNLAQRYGGEFSILIFGVLSLCLMSFLVYYFIGKSSSNTDPILYIFMLGTFSSVVDSIISLENDGFIHGFMASYLREGEPYLKTAHGTLICYWDGIAHYSMYLMMLAAFAWNQNYHTVGLYWLGSFGHSMLVFIPGNFIGKFGIKPSILLNVPYIVIPVVCGVRFLKEGYINSASIKKSKVHVSVWRRPIDLCMIVGLLLSALISLFRAYATLVSEKGNYHPYIEKYERYIMDPVAYPKMQMLVYFFYFVPFYFIAIYELVWPGSSWIIDLSLIHAGAAAQGQVSYIGGANHYRTPYIYRLSSDPGVQPVFYGINLFLLIFPQVLAYYILNNSVYTTKNNKQKFKHS